MFVPGELDSSFVSEEEESPCSSSGNPATLCTRALQRNYNNKPLNQHSLKHLAFITYDISHE